MSPTPSSVDAAIATVVPRFGTAGRARQQRGHRAVGDVTANDDAEWHRVFDVNVVGHGAPVTGRDAAPAQLTERGDREHLLDGRRARGTATGLYSASKGAVAALTLAMAADHALEGVRVNAVLPATADTPWVSRLLAAADDPEAASAALKAPPTHRPA